MQSEIETISAAQGFHQFLRSRRSVRHFQPRPVDRELLEKIIASATWAPSAHNRQPWRFAVLTGLDDKVKLAREMGVDFRRDLQADGLADAEVEKMVRRSRDRLESAPVVIVLCLDVLAGDSYPDEARQRAEYLMGVQGVALAGENLLLAAHGEGLGGVWVCAPLFAQDTVRRCLDLPKTWDPQGLILLGYPESIPDPRPRRAVYDVARFY